MISLVLIAGASTGFSVPSRAAHPDHPELLRLLDFAEYVAAEDSARALYESAPAGSEDEATGVDLFLRAARLSGRAPVQALLGLAGQILGERESSYGANDPHVANILHELGNLQLRADDPTAAAATHTRALRIRESSGDSLSFDVAASAQALANAKLRLGELKGAKALYSRALRVAEIARPNEAFRRAFAINGLGLVAERQGDLQRARSLYERSLAASYDPRVQDHPRTATIARNLGRLLLREGEGIRALESLQLAFRIRSRRLAPHSLHLGNAAFDLARAEAANGQLDEAIAHARQALTIREERLGAAHAATVSAREELSTLYVERGDFARAEAELERLEAPAGEDARTRDRLQFLRANLSNEQGDYPRARAVYEALLSDRRHRLPADDPRIAATLHNLSEIQRRMGDTEAATRTREEAVAIQQESLPDGDPDRARGLVNLADLWLDRGDVVRARPLLERADGWLREHLGDAHPDRANALYLLAECDQLSGHPADAVAHCEQALGLQRDAYGERHAEVAWGRERLARARLLAGEVELGLRDALVAAELEQRQLRRAVQGLAERSALRFAAASMGATDLALAALVDSTSTFDAAATAEVYDRVLGGRSLILETMLQRKREARRAKRESHSELFEKVRQARARLAAATSTGTLPPSELEALATARSRAEAALARALGSTSESGTPPSTTNLAAQLEPDSALLSFVVFDRSLDPRRPSRHYAGLLLRPDTAPRIVDLASTKKIDALVRDWRRAVAQPLRTGSEARCRQKGAELRRLLLDPFLGPDFDKGNQVDDLWLVLDGALHGLAFAALPLPDGRYWVESGPTLHLLDHERALLEPVVANGSREGAAFGAPDFGPGVPSTDPCTAVSRLRFGPLPASMEEIDEVTARLPQLERFVGPQATEEALRRVAPRSRILHLATHGFFLPADCRTPEVDVAPVGGLRGIGGLRRRGAERAAPVTNPLLRSGLVLAAANLRDARTPSERDGILLAEEILGLTLPAGSWVVLSACDTGVGQTEIGEGVLGLRRAFALAGASELVMSLWSVEDRSTREWMSELYRARWQEGASTAEAARQASGQVLELRRQRGQSTHPFWWAAFVASGTH